MSILGSECWRNEVETHEIQFADYWVDLTNRISIETETYSLLSEVCKTSQITGKNICKSRHKYIHTRAIRSNQLICLLVTLNYSLILMKRNWLFIWKEKLIKGKFDGSHTNFQNIENLNLNAKNIKILVQHAFPLTTFERF